MRQAMSIHELSSMEATHICWESTFSIQLSYNACLALKRTIQEHLNTKLVFVQLSTDIRRSIHYHLT